MSRVELSSVCVYCGSSAGNDPGFAAAARSVGELLAVNGITLVYGGASVGLMGVVADAAVAAGGRVVGVMPRGLLPDEIVHLGLTELIEVSSMHERKQCMFELADAFVALPGGLGTLEELAEIATWAQLGMHRKPIATFDVNGYWSSLHSFLRTATEAGLMRPEYRDLIVNVTGGADNLLAALRSYTPLAKSKWVEVEPWGTSGYRS
jgi:uncharacterized protein (TIGR00730 family)